MKLLSSIVFIVFALITTKQVKAQCTNAVAFVTLAAPTTGTAATFSTCNFAGDYNTLTAVVAGSTYSFDDGVGGCITIHSGTPGGPVVAFGSAPLSWTAGSSGTFYVHYNLDCIGCGTMIACITTTITCTSCGGGGGGGPCATITPIIGCGTGNAVSLTGPGVWDLGTCGFSTPGIESIWSFTATATGIHSLDIMAIAGGFIDFAWVDATSGCGSAAPWNCIGDAFLPGNIGAMNWIAGNTYYILIDPETTFATSVTFNVDCPAGGGPVTAGDCSSAMPVCTNLNFAIDPNGFGLVDELCMNCISNPSINPGSVNLGCLNAGELNSTWFTVNVAVGGTLEFSFGTPGTGNCYDWIMWPMTPTTCADIIGNTAPPIRCNWNGMCDGFTGIAGTLPPLGIASEFEPALAVAAGDVFLICFSNYSSALTTVPLDFFGTADISCTPLPVEMVNFSGIDLGGYNELIWKTESEVNCDKFEIQRSESGLDFEVIGTQDGAGTSLEATNYRFVDYSPNAEMNYYRLKQYDINGAFTYSKIISISHTETTELSVLNASPNPAKDLLSLQLVSPIQGELTIRVLSMNGSVHRSMTESIQKGGNNITIPVSELPIGMYLISVQNDLSGEREMIRFVKN